jgi:hypothetical protein
MYDPVKCAMKHCVHWVDWYAVDYVEFTLHFERILVENIILFWHNIHVIASIELILQRVGYQVFCMNDCHLSKDCLACLSVESVFFVFGTDFDTYRLEMKSIIYMSEVIL